MHAHTCGEKEVVRELENDQHVSLEANVFRFSLFSSIFLGFSILLVSTCLHRDLPETSTLALL